jgi:hypothetical protein
VKTARVINQAISLMLAVMLLTVAGVRSWSDHDDSAAPFKTEKVSKDFSKQKTSDSGDQNQAKIAALSMDAVITPAISFDFSQYFYFIPQPTWHFEAKELVVRTAFRESFFLFSYFHRIFGRFIVTNAP